MTTVYRDVNEALPALAKHIMEKGLRVGFRGNLQTQEVLMANFALTHPLNREVVVPGRKASLPAQIVETAWVLSGKDDIETLLPYLPRAAEFSDDGKVWRAAYGPRLRGWRAHFENEAGDVNGTVDQLAQVVRLLNDERGTRRAVMSIFDPAQDYVDSKDTPCNNWLSFISHNEQLHLQVAIRSNDLIWGWSGINQFEWSVLLEIVAKLTGNTVGTVTYSTTSLHIYERHFEKAEKLAGILEGRGPGAPSFSEPSPRFNRATMNGLDTALTSFWYHEERIRTGAEGWENYRLINDPMFRSWLQVLAFHWTRDDTHLRGLDGTPLWHAAHESPRPVVKKEPEIKITWSPAFPGFVGKLHEEKSAVYGGSWKKRGEAMSIIPNEARKVDRLGVAGAGDSAADTVIDLLVYLIKHRLWLADTVAQIPWFGTERTDGALVDENAAVGHVLSQLEMRYGDTEPYEEAVGGITLRFEQLVKAVDRGDSTRHTHIDDMLPVVYVLAKHLWQQEDDYRGADHD